MLSNAAYKRQNNEINRKQPMIYYTSRLKKALQEKKNIYVWFIMITYTEIFHIYKLHINDFKWLEVSESKQDSVVAS